MRFRFFMGRCPFLARLVGLPLVGLLMACASESAERQVERAFRRCGQSVESGDAGAAAEALSKDFEGPEGMKREEARLFLMGTLSRQKVGVTMVSTQLAVRGRRAEQQVSLLLTGRTGGGLLPEDASRRSFSLRWEKEGSRWKLRELQEVR